MVKLPVRRYTIFDEDFEIGRVRNGVYRNYRKLEKFDPGSMTRAVLTLEVQLSTDTSWGLLGLDEFEAGVWVNSTTGEPAVGFTLHDKEYYKIASNDINLVAGDNVFFVEIDHGSHTEFGHTKGHVRVYVDVYYSDPNNPPGGSAPYDLIPRIKKFVTEHPLEIVAILLGAAFVYKKYRETKYGGGGG